MFVKPDHFFLTEPPLYSRQMLLTYVVLSKAEKHVSCGELFVTTECMTL